MSWFAVLVALSLFCAVSVWCAVLALRWIATDQAVAERVGRRRLLMACIFLTVGASLADGAIRPTDLSDLGLLTLVAWAAITAHIDRVTTWVPDVCAVMLLFGALTHDPSISALDSVFIRQGVCAGSSNGCIVAAATAFAVFLWLVALLAFKVQQMLDSVFLTAADCVAVALPLIAFGTSLGSTLSYLLASALIVLAKRFHFVHRWIGEEDALREGLDDLGRSDMPVSGALPAFMIFAPVTATVAVIHSVQLGW